jgi:NAD(P)-dependent dehydrogenase (short-subunit alcohol dehydrogenase family)
MTALPEAVAVITGANKGIGYHIAEQIIASGKFGRVIVVSEGVDHHGWDRITWPPLQRFVKHDVRLVRHRVTGWDSYASACCRELSLLLAAAAYSSSTRRLSHDLTWF